MRRRRPLRCSKSCLPDSAHIQEKEAEWQLRHRRRRGKNERGIPAPLYSVAQALATLLKQLRSVRYGVELAPAENGVRVRFHDAGHILGSAWLEVNLGGEGRPRRLVFSGDLGMSDRPVLCDPEKAVPTADVLLDRVDLRQSPAPLAAGNRR